MLRLLRPLALIPLLSVASPTPEAPPESRGALKAEEIVFLLGQGVSPARLRVLVARFGVDFSAAPERLRILRDAGADEMLIDAIRAAAPVSRPPSPAARSQPVGRSPAPTPWPAPTSPFEPQMLLVKGGPKGDVFLSRFEITNRQYLAYCQRSGRPRPEAPYWGMPEDLPTVNVTWYDVVSFCRWLSLETGRSYRLPTEAEWEYAARGGLIRRLYPWGDQEPKGRACFGTGALCPVGSYKPNGFGLHDMAGSVSEWCQDLYDSKDGRARVIRGGSWATPASSPELLWLERREKFDPDKTRNEIGFRVAGDP